MSLSSTLKSFMNSPKGRTLVEKGQRELSKPQNQEKLRRAMDKLTKRR